jgi:hypothetical protein
MAEKIKKSKIRRKFNPITCLLLKDNIFLAKDFLVLLFSYIIKLLGKTKIFLYDKMYINRLR